MASRPAAGRRSFDYQGVKTCPHCGTTSRRRVMAGQSKIRVRCGQKIRNGEPCGASYTVELVDGKEVTKLVAVL